MDQRCVSPLPSLPIFSFLFIRAHVKRKYQKDTNPTCLPHIPFVYLPVELTYYGMAVTPNCRTFAPL
jgi:hypothetical protein